MEDFKKILVVGYSLKYCKNLYETGINLARKYHADLYVLYSIHDPFNVEGWNLPIPSLEKEFQYMVDDAKNKLDHLLGAERKNGLKITEWIKEGKPAVEIEKAVREENIDLIVLPAHAEGRFEHFLFGHDADRVIRSLPASILLVKCHE